MQYLRILDDKEVSCLDVLGIDTTTWLVDLTAAIKQQHLI